jgi:4-hydroxy-4-methyl-2-oxoglutarate aldolase
MGTGNMTDNEKFSWIRENLYVPVICDVLDEQGYRNQAMHHRLRPLDPGNCAIIGRARTLRWMETDYVVEEDPYGPEIEALDSLQPGDVVVHSTDYAGLNAPWGELMTTVSQVRGAVGCICDSQIRDCLKIMDMNFPVFTRGIRPVDSMGRSRVMDYDVPVRSGDVLVNPGDLIVADFDGVVVVPRDIEDEVLELAADKVSKEKHSLRELRAGKTLREVYDTYGVL